VIRPCPRSSFVRAGLTFFAALAVFTGCDFPTGGEHPPVYQTKILDVLVEPNPVAIGDTALFTVIIRDSLDTSFRFTWFGGSLSWQITEQNSIRWVADVPAGHYNFALTADNGIQEEVPPTHEFVVLVVEPD
jgi:hypothetical protein